MLFTRNDEIHHHNTSYSHVLHLMIRRTEATYITFRSKNNFYLKLYFQRNIYKRNHNLYQEINYPPPRTLNIKYYKQHLEEYAKNNTLIYQTYTMHITSLNGVVASYLWKKS